MRRDLEIVDGYVVPREHRSRNHQKAGTRLSLALEDAVLAQHRRTGGGECYTARPGAQDGRLRRRRDPALWLVEFDKAGALSLERYALVGGECSYRQIGTFYRDMGPTAVEAGAPFPITIEWRQLEIAPRSG